MQSHYNIRPHSVFLLLLWLLVSCAKDKDSSQPCPPGMTGPDCNTPEYAQKMFIHKIIIKRFPNQNNGLPWDSTNGPDICIELQGPGNQFIYNTYSQPIYNAIQGNEYHILPSSPIEYTHTYYFSYILMYDHDSPILTEMGTVYIPPIYYTTGYPSTLIIDPGGPISYHLEVSYEF